MTGCAQWWLVDDRFLAVGHFDETGRVLGSGPIADSDVVVECMRVRDVLWASGVAHRDYKSWPKSLRGPAPGAAWSLDPGRHSPAHGPWSCLGTGYCFVCDDTVNRSAMV
ncbi:DUF6879 family protein [Streptomyces xanthophaeus]|uniref:DUF6879 family protein n=1 Tax=Streptomyces xanthophaeus TaxID=67385 RepID=UPI00343729D4